jgi:hypothetical protein
MKKLSGRRASGLPRQKAANHQTCKNTHEVFPFAATGTAMAGRKTSASMG